MSKNLMRMLTFTGIVFVLFNVVALVVPFEKNGVFWISYVFGLIAILVQLPVMKLAFSGDDSVKSKFYGFPIARISIVYALLQMVLSFLFMIFSHFVPIWIPIVLYVLILGFSAIGFIASDIMREEIVRQDVKIQKNVSFMRNLQSKVNPMVEQCDDASKKAVKAFAENLKYSDPVSGESLKEIENELSYCIDELQAAIVDGDSDNILVICKKAENTLTERNRLCKISKNGGGM